MGKVFTWGTSILIFLSQTQGWAEMARQLPGPPDLPGQVYEVKCDNIHLVLELYSSWKLQGDQKIVDQVAASAAVLAEWPHTLRGKMSVAPSIENWQAVVEAVRTHSENSTELLFQFIDRMPSCVAPDLWEKYQGDYDQVIAALEGYLDLLDEFDFVNITYLEHLTAVVSEVEAELQGAGSELDPLPGLMVNQLHKKSGSLLEFAAYYRLDSAYLNDIFSKVLELFSGVGKSSSQLANTATGTIN